MTIKLTIKRATPTTTIKRNRYEYEMTIHYDLMKMTTRRDDHDRNVSSSSVTVITTVKRCSSASVPDPGEVGIPPHFASTPQYCDLAGPVTVRFLPGSITLERRPPVPLTTKPVG